MKKNKTTRRDFIKTITAASVYSLLPKLLFADINKKIKTIQDLIDLLIHEATGSLFPETVDVVKIGDPNQKLTGIVTTFMANVNVIQKAIELNANFIITHEPIFYSHEDRKDWLENNATYQYKKKLLEDNGIVVWRFHDYMHSIKPDPVVKATINKLGWEKYSEKNNLEVFNFPEQTFEGLILNVKNSIGVQSVKVLGNPNMLFKKVGLWVGSGSGQGQIEFMNLHNLDVLITGESSEYEVSEYIRDSNYAGGNKALIVLGHANTEEPGMKWLAEWLKPKLNTIPINFVAVEDLFSFR